MTASFWPAHEPIYGLRIEKATCCSAEVEVARETTDKQIINRRDTGIHEEP